MGSFVQTLPPIVPRFRTWTSAICAHTSPRIGRARASLGRHDLRVGGHCADLERPVRPELDPLQVVEPVQVDQRVRRAGARFHDVDQRLAACESPGAVVGGEQLERFREGRRLGVGDLAEKHHRGFIKCQRHGAQVATHHGHTLR